MPSGLDQGMVTREWRTNGLIPGKSQKKQREGKTGGGLKCGWAGEQKAREFWTKSRFKVRSSETVSRGNRKAIRSGLVGGNNDNPGDEKVYRRGARKEKKNNNNGGIKRTGKTGLGTPAREKPLRKSNQLGGRWKQLEKRAKKSVGQIL